MSYYDRYDWYDPSISQQQGGMQRPMETRQPQQQDSGMNMGDMYNAYQKYQAGAAGMTPAYTSAGANPMLQGASYSSTGAMSPAATGGPMTQSWMAQTPATGAFSGGSGGALGGGSGGALSGGGGAGGGSSWMAAAGPWAALAAAVAWNEENSRKQGRRADSSGERMQDMFSGKALQRDTDFYGDKVGGVGGDMIKFGGQMGHPEGAFNMTKDWAEKGFDFTKDSITDPFSVFSGLGDLF